MRRVICLLLLMLCSTPVCEAWCCRACAKCMCTVYGVCPSGRSAAGSNGSSAKSQSTALRKFSVEQVVAFISSVGVNGSRQTCTPDCALLQLFDGSLFRKQDTDGEKLAHFFHAHETRFTREVIHNNTARAAHAGWVASHGFFPGGLNGEQYLALTTRLRDALRDAGALSDARRQRRLRVTSASAAAGL